MSTQAIPTLVVYIVPAWSDQGGKCRIVARQVNEEVAKTMNAAASYREAPQLWGEFGHMSSQGKLVSFGGTAAQRQELLECEPLSAGLVMTFAPTATPSVAPVDDLQGSLFDMPESTAFDTHPTPRKRKP